MRGGVEMRRGKMSETVALLRWEGGRVRVVAFLQDPELLAIVCGHVERMRAARWCRGPSPASPRARPVHSERRRTQRSMTTGQVGKPVSRFTDARGRESTGAGVFLRWGAERPASEE